MEWILQKVLIFPCLFSISFIIYSIMKSPLELIYPISYKYLFSLSFNINNILLSLLIYSHCVHFSFSNKFIKEYSFRNNKSSSFIRVKFEKYSKFII